MELQKDIKLKIKESVKVRETDFDNNGNSITTRTYIFNFTVYPFAIS